MAERITASSFSNGLKLMGFIVPLVVSGLTAAAVLAFSTGTYVADHKDLREDFDKHMIQQEIRWEKDDISDQEYLLTVTRIDEKLKFLKELYEDL